VKINGRKYPTGEMQKIGKDRTIENNREVNKNKKL